MEPVDYFSDEYEYVLLDRERMDDDNIKRARFLMKRFNAERLLTLLDAFQIKSKLVRIWPELPLQVLSANLYDAGKKPNLALVRRLYDEFGFDVNHVHLKYGSVLHMFCHFTRYQDEICQFLTSLSADGYKVDIEIEARKRRRTRDHFFKATPLQYAIEKGSYQLALYLIKHKASVDKLIFDKYSWRENVDARAKPHYLRLIKALVYLNVLTLKQVYQSVHLSKAEKSELNCFIGSRTLVEHSLRVIRKSFYSATGNGSLDNFIEQLDEQILVDPQIRAFSNLEHL